MGLRACRLRWNPFRETSQWVVPEEVLCLDLSWIVSCIYVYCLTFSVLKYFQYGFEFKCPYLFILCFGRAEKMAFYGFTDGACRHTLNFDSVAWVLYSPVYDLVS